MREGGPASRRWTPEDPIKEEAPPPKDGRHRRALARAAHDLHVALRPLKEGGGPAFTAMKGAADLMTRGGLDVTGAKRTVIDMVPPPPGLPAWSVRCQGVFTKVPGSAGA